MEINNILIALCEGPHDTAFLYRILRTRCYKVFDGTLQDLPKVIGGFIESKNKSENYNKLKINVLKNEFLPYRILYKDDKLILLYSLGGDKDYDDDAKNKRLTILQHFFNDIASQVKDESNYGETFISKNASGLEFKYSFLFFYDADQNKQEKIDIVNKYLKKLNLDFTLQHNDVVKNDHFSFGTYIFSDNDDKGALENILYGLMQEDNEGIFKAAIEYYETHFDDKRTKRLSTTCENNNKIIKEKRKDSPEKDILKSTIAIAGQLQKKGKSNVVIIEDSDYITLDKIQNNGTLQEIANFIEISYV